MAIEISLVTDELSADPRTAFELGPRMGHPPLRAARLLCRASADDLPGTRRHRLRQMIAEFGASITAISPGLFKIPYPAAEPAESNLGWMDRGFFAQWEAQASALTEHTENSAPRLDRDGAGIRDPPSSSLSASIAPAHPGGPAPTGRDRRASAAPPRASRRRGLTLLIETEEGFWGDTGARTAALIEAVGAPGLAVNWDPANSFCEGDIPYPDGYEAVRRHTRNVHFKDAAPRGSDGPRELRRRGRCRLAGPDRRTSPRPL